jgi:gluconate 2-dehydrogenase alpha chain
MGAMSGTVAVELAKAGYKVVGIERGPYWDFTNDFYFTKYDEWGIGYMRKFDLPLSTSTCTLRNNRNQYALPIRRNTAGVTGQYITQGFGVGGMCQHYGGLMGRYPPWVYQVYTSTVNKYGLPFLNAAEPHQDVTDWPMTYSDYVPYYEEWEKMWGVTGTNEGPLMPNLDSYPLPPSPDTPVGAAFRDAATALGYHPFPTPTALASKAFVNQYGVAVNSCAYDGWCGAPCNYVCETGAKASSAFRTVPAAVSSGNFELRLNSYVFRLDTDSSGKVTAARYYDPEGGVNVQPGKVFFNGLWGYNIVKLMLTSKIGTPYDPSQMSGSLGRGPSMGVPGPNVRSVSGTLDNIGGNAYPAGNALGGGYSMLDLADDNFDHTGLDFIGGAYPIVGSYLGGGPANFDIFANGPDPSMMGSDFKASLKDHYLISKTPLAIQPFGMWPPTTDWFIDLDPNYTDQYGDPLARLTIDYGVNTTKCANYLAPKFADILTKMGASNVKVSDPVNEIHTFTWPAHIRGGARIGSDKNTSVFNKWQQCWTSPNLFAAGEVTVPVGDNTTTGGTHPAGAMSYVAAEGIKKYLQNPSALV